MDYQDHELATIFPLMSDADLSELADDIREQGLQEPVWLFEDKILDGRNRYRACQQANVEPTYRQYEGTDPLGFVISRNLHRRHLTTSQRALVAARLESTKHGNLQRISQDANLHLGSDETTRGEAAEALQVSPRTVATASKVLDEAVPEVVAAVESGEVAISAAAEVAKLPKSEQKKAAKKGADGIREAAKKSREARIAKKAEDTPEPVNLPEDEQAETEQVDSEPDDTPIEEADPLADAVSVMNRICNHLDTLKADVLKLKETPAKPFIHFESVTGLMEGARKALWQSRPNRDCDRCKGDIKDDCRACYSTGKTTESKLLKGGRR